MFFRNVIDEVDYDRCTPDQKQEIDNDYLNEATRRAEIAFGC